MPSGTKDCRFPIGNRLARKHSFDGVNRQEFAQKRCILLKKRLTLQVRRCMLQVRDRIVKGQKSGLFRTVILIAERHDDDHKKTCCEAQRLKTGGG